MREVVSNTSPLLYLHQLGRLDLGKGESEAIAIAHERGALLILDDGLARRHAGLISSEDEIQGCHRDRNPRSASQG
jgi:predicted nucleic acid-binding protein